MVTANESVLKDLFNHQSNPCVSVVISTEISAFDDKEKVRLKFKKTSNEVQRLLVKKYSETIADRLMETFNQMISEIDTNHMPKGVGLYLTPEFSKAVAFQLPVKDMILVDSFFETAQLEEEAKKAFDYGVLLLSLQKTRLLMGSGPSLSEVEDKQFPKSFIEEFQVQRTSPGSFYNTEESKIDQKRHEDFFRSVDQLLDQYIGDKPLIILGVPQNLATFKSVSRHSGAIIGEKDGNHDRSTVNELRGIIEPILEEDSLQAE